MRLQPAETRAAYMLAALPFGTRTTYGDLAELIGSHQMPVGQHLASTPGCSMLIAS